MMTVPEMMRLSTSATTSSPCLLSSSETLDLLSLTASLPTSELELSLKVSLKCLIFVLNSGLDSIILTLSQFTNGTVTILKFSSLPWSTSATLSESTRTAVSDTEHFQDIRKVSDRLGFISITWIYGQHSSSESVAPAKLIIRTKETDYTDTSQSEAQLSGTEMQLVVRVY